MSRKKKILISAVDIGSRISVYTEFIKSNKGKSYDVESFVKYVLPVEHGYFSNYTISHVFKNYSFFKKIIISLFFFIKSLIRYDIFLFLSNETILSNKLRWLELFIFKLLRKRIIFLFVGSDIRSNEYLNWKAENIISILKGDTIDRPSTDFINKKFSIIKYFSDSILVATPDLIRIIPSATYFPIILDTVRLEKLYSESIAFKNKDVISIMHIPSNSSLKGTKFISKILAEIKEIYGDKVEILHPPNERYREDLPYSVSKKQLMDYYKRADIVIDQLLIGWYGMQSLEALYLGKKCLCFIDEKLLNFLPMNCPILSTNVLTLKEDLVAIIESGNLLVDVDANKKWIYENHSMESIKSKFSSTILNESN